MMDLTFWQVCPSIHQAPLMKELAHKWNGDVTILVERDLSDRRKEQGWERPDYSPASLIVEPSRSERKAHLNRRKEPGNIHFFNGLHAYPDTYWTFKQAVKTDAELGVLLEAGRPNDGLKSYLRKARYSVHGLRWRKHLDCVLAMGDLGVRYYRSCYFPESKIHHWGYFVEPDAGLPTEENIVTGEEFTIVFVANIIRRKGIDLLIRALDQLDNRNWNLVVIGDGPLLKKVKQIASSSDISERINWVGTLDAYADVRATMRSADLCVLPSRYDGWGAVVNEALHEGTPVVTTETCGAADLIQHETLGAIVPAADVDALSTAIEDKMNSGLVDKKIQKRIQKWAEKSISPAVAAKYLVNILNSKNSPVPPWYQSYDSL